MLEPIKDWLGLVSTGGFLLVAVIGWVVSKTLVSRREFEDRITRVDGYIGVLSARMGSMESELKAIPTRAEVHRLDLKITAMQGDINGVRTALEDSKSRFERIDIVLHRIEGFLLNGPDGP